MKLRWLIKVKDIMGSRSTSEPILQVLNDETWNWEDVPTEVEYI